MSGREQKDNLYSKVSMRTENVSHCHTTTIPFSLPTYHALLESSLLLFLILLAYSPPFELFFLLLLFDFIFPERIQNGSTELLTTDIQTVSE